MAALFGLVVGSFVNVCIHRIPRAQSIVWPGSKCPACGAPVWFLDNVPLLSYVWLGGRCRRCKAPISARYPLVEALTALMFVAYSWKFGLAPALAVNLLLGCLSLVLIFIDYDWHLLPDVLTLPGIALGLASSPWQSPEFGYRPLEEWTAAALGLGAGPSLFAMINSCWGALVGGGPLWLVGWLFFKWTGREGLGFGDVKLMAMVGAFLGWRMVLVVLVWGSLIGSLVGIFFILFQGKGRDYHYPFGTFLGMATLLAVLWAADFLSWYAGFL